MTGYQTFAEGLRDEIEGLNAKGLDRGRELVGRVCASYDLYEQDWMLTMALQALADIDQVELEMALDADFGDAWA